MGLLELIRTLNNVRVGENIICKCLGAFLPEPLPQAISFQNDNQVIDDT